MRPDKIVCGRLYRLKSSPDYGYVRPVAVLKPGSEQMKAMARGAGIKPFKFFVIKCEHIVYKDSTIGFIRYFRPVDIIECNEEVSDEV
jgi:hypothetical protein